MTSYERPISPPEWFYLAAARRVPPFALQLVVEGEGDIGLDELRRAVELASAAHPGSRLVRRGRRWVATPRPAGVAEVRQDEPGPGGCGAAMHRPFDLAHGPTCEVLRVAGSPANLVFRAFHGVMDARGMLIWAQDVMRALRGEPPEGATSTLYDYALVERLGEHGRRPANAFAWRAPVDDVAGRTEPSAFRWHRRTLPCQPPALAARLVEAVARAARDPQVRCMIPVDLRRHDPALRATANLSLPIILDVAREERWEEIHARLLASLAARHELARGDEGLASRLPLGALEALLDAGLALYGRRRRYMCSAVVSHVGKIDLAALSTPTFRARTAYSLPAHAPFAPLSFASTEAGSGTEIVLAIQGGAELDARVHAFLDELVATLAPPAAPPVTSPVAVPLTGTVVERFKAQVARTPDAVAVDGPTGSWSYAELDRRSDAVAHALAERVPPGARIGLLAPRAATTLAGVWGILKARAAYVPLDPQHPDRRVAELLRDAGAPVCLVARAELPRLAALGLDVEALVLEDLPASAAPFTCAVTPDDLAYVLYTSGSTGRPKGVEITHRSLAHYVGWATDRYGVDASTRFAWFTSLGFDLTGTSLFLPLLAGGSVAVIPDEVSHLTLQRMVATSGANALKLTPTHLELLLRLEIAPGGVRTLVIGGEQLSGALAARVQRLFGPECRLFNEYGPTEATIGCLVHRYDPLQDPPERPVPIGLPAPDTAIWLLDEARQSVAPGAPGELYLAGPQLARGYLNRPELASERFVMLDDRRAYRTGDRVRWREGGVLEYLGRTDDQLKIRGHRVEPGEIETLLEAHPAVRRACVRVRRQLRGDTEQQVLCAWVQPAGELDLALLERYLREHLPAALVPTALVPVAAMPLTVHGKIDLAALPAPEGVPAAEVAPADELTEAIARIWAATLGLPVPPGAPGADFHLLGGDSLSLLEMLMAVAREVVGSRGEPAFMGELSAVIREPTLERVVRAARQAREASV